MIDRDPRVHAVAASDMVCTAVLTSLVRALIGKGVLTSREVREIYENALLMLETQQGYEPEISTIIHAARGIIQAQLRPDELPSDA
jgi:hypothetical protein